MRAEGRGQFSSNPAAGLCCGLFFFQAEDGIRDGRVTGVQTCALPICHGSVGSPADRGSRSGPVLGQGSRRQRRGCGGLERGRLDRRVSAPVHCVVARSSLWSGWVAGWASSPPPGRAAGSGSSFPWRKTGNDLEGRELRASISGLMGVAITRESAYEQQEEPCRRATIPHSVSAPVAVRDRLAGANLRGL